MRSISKVTAAVSATAALTLATGCGGAAKSGAGSDPKTSEKPTASSAPRKSFDPPQTFAAQGAALPEAAGRGSISMVGTLIKPLPLALHDTHAYIAAANSLQILDTSTGTTTTTVRPRHQPAVEPDTETGAPVPTRDGKQLLVPFTVTFPGKGTTPSRTGIELVAVDTTDRRTAWTLDIDTLPSWAEKAPAQARLVATTKNAAVLSVTSGNRGATYAVDLATRKVSWHNDDVAAAAVIGDTAVAVTTKDTVRQQVTGLAVDHDGKQLWNTIDGFDLTVRPAGPHLAAVTGNDYDSGDSVSALLTPDGGKAADLPGETSGLSCRYDDASVTVCQTDGPRVFALDATTGKQLWNLPEQGTGRIAPKVTAAWHGAVYGTTGNGPVVLDAKTGADRNTSPGAAPAAVNEYTGVAVADDEQHTVVAHPATG
ncbi:PQQ-binding-like beta-propeller repeat protein [Streptomyces chrestomyceticus]|uniref:outer membrane protein assembly factor BamB family protein n=1 Tax=Streptomyces chrestomyceticus TaxID=68185 RepID=UPI003405CCDE